MLTPRFIDAAQCAVAAAPSLGIPAAEMEAAPTPGVFAHGLAAFFRETGNWEGTPTALHAALKSRAIPNLPANAGLVRRLQQISLALYGIKIEHSQTHNSRKIRATIARSCRCGRPFRASKSRRANNIEIARKLSWM